MGPIRIRPESEIRDAVAVAYDEQRRRISRLLPEADIQHIGATAVPGALTKGDLDLVVRVRPDAFANAVDVLSGHYAIHQPLRWSESLASFTDADAEAPPVGVQLVVARSAEDALFGPFRDALIADPSLLRDLNALKRKLDGHEYKDYTDAKGAFVESVLARLTPPDDPA